jgi:hypothetical protein
VEVEADSDVVWRMCMIDILIMNTTVGVRIRTRTRIRIEA